MGKITTSVLVPLILVATAACTPATGLDSGQDSGQDAEAAYDDLANDPSGDMRRPWRPRPDRPRPTPVLPTPYGYWGLNGYVSSTGLADVSDRLGAAVFQVANESPTWTVNTLLPMVKSAGMTVTLRMAGDHAYYTSSGNFDLDAWKDRLDLWAGSGIQAYIDDGTLVGHMVLDDIHNFSGADPTGDQLDEMARYSKEVLPGLMTFVRCQATTMPTPTAGVYVHLDASVNQYQRVDATIEDYVADEHAAARALDLGIINGLNIADGGDGSSGQPGWRTGRYAMSPEEILDYGGQLAAMPGVGMFLNWEYDGEEAWSDGSIGADYFDQAEVQAALAGLGEVVRAVPAMSLLRPTAL